MRLWYLAGLAVVVLGCGRTRADLREWRPTDHEHTSEPSRRQVDVSDGGSQMLRAHGLDEVIIAAWRTHCVRCHGVAGRGDGPEAQRWHPRDLGAADWQRSVTDADMQKVIATGKGAMPATNLPETTLSGLVRLVRLMAEPGAAGPRPTAQPSVSSAPAAAESAQAPR